MVPRIPPDVFARHEAYLGIKDERCVGRRCNPFPGPTAKDIGGAHCSVKIGDRGQFGRGSGQEHMEDLSIAEKV